MNTLISSLVTLILLLATSACAAPIAEEKRSISVSLVSTFSLFEQYAAAAYCKDDNDNSPGLLTCSADNCPSVLASGAYSVAEFSQYADFASSCACANINSVGAADATGFVAVDNINRLIIVSYRGSVSVGNWIGNFHFEFAPFDCSGCMVHAGFLDSWTSSRDTVVAAVQQASSNHPDYPVVVTGHSLGAAISTLAAADLRQQGFNVALYTYGSPMVGNDAFATFVTNQPGGNYRVTHAHDPIPKLPSYWLSYRHVSPEYWITTPTGQTPSTNNIQLSSGIMDLKGNQGSFSSSLFDHLWYFNSVTGCSPIFEV